MSVQGRRGLDAASLPATSTADHFWSPLRPTTSIFSILEFVLEVLPLALKSTFLWIFKPFECLKLNHSCHIRRCWTASSCKKDHCWLGHLSLFEASEQFSTPRILRLWGISEMTWKQNPLAAAIRKPMGGIKKCPLVVIYYTRPPKHETQNPPILKSHWPASNQQ